MEWKIFSMEWKKIASMECGKILFQSIPYHALVPDCLIFTEIARLPNSLPFFIAGICCADKIKLISAQRNDSTQ